MLKKKTKLDTKQNTTKTKTNKTQQTKTIRKPYKTNQENEAL